MKRWTWLLAAALATAAIPTASTARADDKNDHEKVVSIDKIPAAARDALRREAGGAPIVRLVEDTEHGQTTYEAHVRKANEVVDLEVDASGKVLKKEIEPLKHRHD